MNEIPHNLADESVRGEGGSNAQGGTGSLIDEGGASGDGRVEPTPPRFDGGGRGEGDRGHVVWLA